MSARRLVLDAGSLIHIERHPHSHILLDCRSAFVAGYPAILPAVAFAQVWRGQARQHSLAVVRKLTTMVPFTERTADTVGRLLGLARTDDAVDAAVVVAAIEYDAAVVTSDPDDLRRLASAADYPLDIVSV